MSAAGIPLLCGLCVSFASLRETCDVFVSRRDAEEAETAEGVYVQ
jgi:hypothetical protein